MSNINAPFGLRPVRRVGGAPLTGSISPFWVPAAYATSLFIGDPVVRTGESATSTLSGLTTTLPVVGIATGGATNQITGVIVGFEPNPTIQADGYGRASTLRKAYVCDAPDVLFEVQEDGDAGAIAIASIGLNANLITGTGSTNFKKSGWTLDSSSVGSDATFQVRIDSLVERADNEPATAYQKFLVLINLHTNRLGAVAGL